MTAGKKVFAVILTALVSAFAGLAPAVSQQESTCSQDKHTAPEWMARPNAQQLLSVFPKRALRAEKGGKVLLDCRVRDDGAMEDCSVRSEEPKGYGFGEAALALAPYFRIKPRTCDGATVGGARASFPIDFGFR